MGYPIDHVLTVGEFIDEFTCNICFQLVDRPQYVRTCSHVFCENCFGEWRATVQGDNVRCAKCNTTCGNSDIGALATLNPLANRILGKLQVKCTMPSCSWVGNYSDVAQHLVSATSHLDPKGDSKQSGSPKVDAQAQADALKQQGNQRFEARQFDDAYALYSKAILLAPMVTSSASCSQLVH
jgi:DnaJ family protein C protein 7